MGLSYHNCRRAVSSRGWDGWTTLSDRPGLGSELDEDVLARTPAGQATFA
jgi:L-alanine-DL-glutamate epimerase-like enolase superfamily enzyme